MFLRLGPQTTSITVTKGACLTYRYVDCIIDLWAEPLLTMHHKLLLCTLKIKKHSKAKRQRAIEISTTGKRNSGTEMLATLPTSHSKSELFLEENNQVISCSRWGLEDLNEEMSGRVSKICLVRLKKLKPCPRNQLCNKRQPCYRVQASKASQCNSRCSHQTAGRGESAGWGP